MNGEGLEKFPLASHMNGSMGSESYFKTLPCCPGQPLCTPLPLPASLLQVKLSCRCRVTAAHLGQATKVASLQEITAMMEKAWGPSGPFSFSSLAGILSLLFYRV